jgi:leucyl aminopeptidase (aminopeptidase T)
MHLENRIKMFNDVFAPIKGEKVLFLIDTPHGSLKDNKSWFDRRIMAKEWYDTFKEMGKKAGFNVHLKDYKATGRNNSTLPKRIIEMVSKADLVIAMTEYSGTSSLVPIAIAENSKTRIASMPGVEKRMEETAFKANYAEVKKYAIAIKNILNNSIGASILFSTGDTIYIDLRNRKAEADDGDCTKPGKFINFPSGEGFKNPYEAVKDEINKFGSSRTKGILPVNYTGELIRYIIENNRIIQINGNGKKAEEMKNFFSEKESRRNIAELGIGCNPKAVVTGNILEDEKVGGLHIAYGTSTHLNGKVISDIHQDICYPKGAPIEAMILTLIKENGDKIDLIRNAKLRYDLLKRVI